MPRKSRILFKNKNQTGWWIFSAVDQWVSDRQKQLKPHSRCLVWENTHIIRARNRDEAYRKAMKVGGSGKPSRTDGGEWRFAGISMLLPIYDDLEDGAEILWRVRGDMPIARIRKLVKTKQTLPVFDDTPSEP